MLVGEGVLAGASGRTSVQSWGTGQETGCRMRPVGKVGWELDWGRPAPVRSTETTELGIVPRS